MTRALWLARHSEALVEGEIEIRGRRFEVSLGLRRVDELLALAGGSERPLLFERVDEAATPLDPSDHILLRGGERLVEGGVVGEEGRRLSQPIRFMFNGQALELDCAKADGRTLKANDAEFPDGRLFVESVDEVDVEVADDATVVVREEDVYFVVPRSPDGDDGIDLEECGKHGRRPPRGHRYRIRVDGEKLMWDAATITGAQVLALVDKNYQDWTLNEKHHGGRRTRVAPDAVVDLCSPGVERFETVRHQAQQGRDG